MKTVDRALQRIENNKKAADSGDYNCIPFNMSRFENFLPGIQQKTYYIVTANSGVGKTQITDHMFLYTPYDFVLANKNKGYKLKIFYYSLEMDKETKLIAGMGRYAFIKFGVRSNVFQLQSLGKNRITDDTLKVIRQTRDYFAEMEDYVTIYDDQINPYGIYKEVDAYARANGKIITKDITIHNGETSEVKTVFDYYIPNDPKEYVIVIVDHLAELTNESGLDIKGTIERHSDNQRKLRNRYGYTLVDVQQQAAYQEGKEGKLEPSLDGLGESKLTQRKANIVLGLFDPFRHEIPSYRGYDILKLRDNFRSLSILKNRNGISNVRTGLYFDGAVNYFNELPKSDDPKMQEFYRKLRGNG